MPWTGSRFDDVVAWRSGFLDIGFVRYETMQIHDVPYRSLLPEQVDGLARGGPLHLREPRRGLGG